MRSVRADANFRANFTSHASHVMSPNCGPCQCLPCVTRLDGFALLFAVLWADFCMPLTQEGIIQSISADTTGTAYGYM